jgi:hypothetical protein
MKVFEVEYNNYTFRSKTEAKWAKLFDVLEIEYVFEPDTYVLDIINDNNKRKSIRYLPDFYLPSLDIYLEIKNNGKNRPNMDECQKAFLLSTQAKKRVIILFGEMKYETNFMLGNFFCYHPNGTFDMHYRLTRCTKCNLIDFTKFGNVFDVNCNCQKDEVHKHLYNSISLKNGFNTVKQTRFGW